VVVGFVSNDDSIFVPIPLRQVHDACIFSGSLHNRWTIGREFLQMMPAAFVRAMLAPLCIERVHFDNGRIPANAVGDSPQFIGPQSQSRARRRTS
jgi:hypothetical protein